MGIFFSSEVWLPTESDLDSGSFDCFGFFFNLFYTFHFLRERPISRPDSQQSMQQAQTLAWHLYTLRCKKDL